MTLRVLERCERLSTFRLSTPIVGGSVIDLLTRLHRLEVESHKGQMMITSAAFEPVIEVMRRQENSLTAL